MLKKLCAATLLLFCCTVVVSAQENRWYDSFFVSGAVQYYMVPELFSGLIKPTPGFRGALGYEYKRFYLAIESGYTHIEGTNPFVLDLRLVPLMFKFGYALPIRWGLGLQADLGAGVMFSQTAHYRHVIEIFTEQQSNSPASSPLVGARLYVTYTIPRVPIKIFAGGGLDAILEHEGIIPLPTIEGGVSIRPFGFFKSKSRRQETELQEEDISEIIFAHTPENLVIEDGEQGKTMRLLNAVYFWANSTVFIEEYQHILDEAGRRLRENPDARITLRGYAAPFGTEAGQVTLSAARAWRCAEYLMQTYGIAEERVGMEFYGADKMPEWAGADWESWRCVELLIDANEQ